MWLRGRLLVFFLLYCYSVKADKFYSRKAKQVYGFLDYFQSPRINQVTPLQIPLFILPVIIGPLINLQENVTTSGSDADEKQSVHLHKRLANKMKTNFTEIDNDSNDIEISFRQSLNRGTKVPKRETNIDVPTVTQNNDIHNETIQVTNTNEVDLNDSTTASIKTIEKIKTDTKEPLKSTNINNDDITVQQSSDGRWKNFTQITDLSSVKKNETSLLENSKSFVAGTNLTEGVYAAPSYNNTMIDQVSITTNSYTNLETPPTQYDRWKMFSSLKGGNLETTGFKPLAGLYYDGFLTSPLIKIPGFMPYN